MPETLTDYRRHKRLPIRIPIIVKGLDKNNKPFTEATETLNGSVSGIGFVLRNAPENSSDLVVSIFHNLNLFQIRTHVRHVTPLNDEKLIGVQFRGVRDNSGEPQ